MEPKNAVILFLTALPALVFLFWRLSPDYGHSWVLVGLMPLLAFICSILFLVSLVLALKNRTIRWWISALVNAAVIVYSFFEFLG
jgi:hypothetical protein